MGIKHYKDLDAVEKNKLSQYIENGESFSISLKIDGSANIGFGLDDSGRLFVARFVKGQTQHIYSADHWPKTPQYNSIRAVAKCLFDNVDVISNKLHLGSYVNAEIIYESTPNVIEYNIGNKIVLHDSKYNMLEGINISTDIDLYKYDSVTGKIQKESELLSFDFIPFVELNIKLEDKNLPSESFFFDFTSNPTLTKFFPNIDKHEGVVISVGDMVYKCVDDFPNINKSKWEARERMEMGFGPAGNFEMGVKTKFLQRISELYGLPMIKSPASNFLLNKKYSNVLYYKKVKNLLKDKCDHSFSRTFSDSVIDICNTAIKELDDIIYDYKTKHVTDPINYRKTMECYTTNKIYYNTIMDNIKKVSFLSSKTIATILLSMIISKNNKLRSVLGG